MSDRPEPNKNCQPLAPRELLYELAIALVDHPADVWIETHESIDKKILTLIVHASPEDRGKVIGREGSTMKLLKEFMGRVAAARHMKIMLVVSESDEAEPPGQEPA
jgi:predicted RNA-binding protein YlqC (UPF0109 family)